MRMLVRAVFTEPFFGIAIGFAMISIGLALYFYYKKILSNTIYMSGTVTAIEDRNMGAVVCPIVEAKTETGTIRLEYYRYEYRERLRCSVGDNADVCANIKYGKFYFADEKPNQMQQSVVVAVIGAVFLLIGISALIRK